MRVFNISHHKCGTTSMFKALEMLGFQSYHWERPLEILNAFLESRIESEELLRGDNTAYSDLPFTLMYRDLVNLYPDSKFIFVRRERKAWVESLRKHFVMNWPVPLPVHTLVYGYSITSANFDASVCLRAYDRICADILEFFEGKPNFLLLEFENLSWQPLCKFLGRQVPAEPFPWYNKANSESSSSALGSTRANGD